MRFLISCFTLALIGAFPMTLQAQSLADLLSADCEAFVGGTYSNENAFGADNTVPPTIMAMASDSSWSLSGFLDSGNYSDYVSSTGELTSTAEFTSVLTDGVSDLNVSVVSTISVQLDTDGTILGLVSGPAMSISDGSITIQSVGTMTTFDMDNAIISGPCCNPCRWLAMTSRVAGATRTASTESNTVKSPSQSVMTSDCAAQRTASGVRIRCAEWVMTTVNEAP